MAMNFGDFFSQATGISSGPYDYQQRLAQNQWPDLLEIPTGLGKTAAVVLAWLYKRRIREDSETPRRLVYCLPMRVLVEQTVNNIETWLRAHDMHGEPGQGRVSVNVLMGGASHLRQAHWAHHPEEDTILVGTQDMLLSRALMRGYGMSRYQWPVHFALLHNDAMWVYDEVQLMGPALPTSTQLEGLRRRLSTDKPSRSLWISATLHQDWLRTVDFREHVQTLSVSKLAEADRNDPNVAKRLNASKALAAAKTRLNAGNKKETADYVEALSDEIADAHQAGQQTLVIVNRVERAQALYTALKEKLPESDHLLLHARFRPLERRAIEQRLHEEPRGSGRVIVATQAIEAGVDISSHTLFTELAPWSSMVQRFGRCNRAGEHAEAQVLWIDIAAETDSALPYEPETLAGARDHLAGLQNADPGSLPEVDGSIPQSHVLRLPDLMGLFSTDPDLSGFDVDVSPYIRDPGNAQSQVFWRDFNEEPAEEVAPTRDELCLVGLGQLKDYLGKKERKAWAWDPLGERWRPIDRNRLRPGQIFLLRTSAGGYLENQGFLADAKGAVTPVDTGKSELLERYGDDTWTTTGDYLALTAHLQDVAGEAQMLAKQLQLSDEHRNVLAEAGRWHDVGKAHPAFQLAICGDDTPDKETLWAKSAKGGIPRYRILDKDGKEQPRKGFRHELASMLVWIEHGNQDKHSDLIAYLITAHHGKVRMGLRALPNEHEPPDPETLYARGVWHGDRLPAVALNGKAIPETRLRLDLMRLGEGPQGASWAERTQRLLQAYGPFRLAWLETLVRIADWRASARGMEAEND